MRLREATTDDARLLYGWRNDPETRSASLNGGALNFAGHEAWLVRALANPARHLLIVEDDVALGSVRFDHIKAQLYEISIVVAPEQRGRGIAGEMIDTAVTWLFENTSAEVVKATIRKTNQGSARAFKKAGFATTKVRDNFIAMARQR